MQGWGLAQVMLCFSFILLQIKLNFLCGIWREDSLGLGRWAEPCYVPFGYLLMSYIQFSMDWGGVYHHFPGAVEVWAVHILEATWKGPGKESLLHQLLLSSVR